jgi:subtilisin
VPRRLLPAVLATLVTLAIVASATIGAGPASASVHVAGSPAPTGEIATGTGSAQVEAEVDQAVADGGQAQVLITMDPAAASAGAARTAGVTAEAGDRSAADLAQALGARVLDTPDPVLAATVDADELDALRQRPDVARVAPDRVHRPAAVDGNLATVGAPEAWPTATGAGQTIAIVDTGVDAGHPMLSGRVVAEACFSGGTASHLLSPQGLCPTDLGILGATARQAIGPGAARPCTLAVCEHGTHVAGIAAGSPASSGGARGVAPDAHVIAVQVFTRITSQDHCGNPSTCIVAYDSDLLEAMAWLQTQTAHHDLAAINLSLGGGLSSGPCDDDVLKPNVDALLTLGVPTVAASGNDGDAHQMAWPACISSTISVGATGTGSTPAEAQPGGYSNASAGLRLLAPGTAVRSAHPGGGERTSTGTSMAAPHVAGALAVLRQARGPLPAPLELALLRTTGVPILDERNHRTTPLLQVGAAVRNVAPVGELDVTSLVPGIGEAPTLVTVTGWALDPEVLAPATATITVDGEPAWTGPAVGVATRAGQLHPAHGSLRGVAATLTLPDAGVHRLCLVVDDAGPWPGPPVQVSCTSSAPTRFPDVDGSHPFLLDVEWAAAAGVLDGYPDGTFRPAGALSRQAVAAALHRLAGEPAGSLPGGDHPDPGFSDVDADHPFYDAIAWAVAEGVTTGYPDGTFRPGALISRQAVVVQLHRLAARSATPPTGPHPDPGFSDVGPDHLFHDSIAWAVAEGIATGYPDGAFRPGASTSRQALTAYLHRLVEVIGPG